ncbi:glycosyltransferase [Paludibacter sp. 221]|uniref:glycosyltransferase family 2 protein n=1 Tax=Paludibacter sp. 221 TaxID=2302939 RepID=UPI0013D0C72C|nr:glycosyltransferase [Paludibacter sp. 221]NDV46714.1 glycosyltransferase [Paludibacter sp. 221]
MEETTRPKVSIILPVHNAGGYLSKCIESLLAQTLKDIELIVVLDCPTDGSDKVAYRFAEHDMRVKVLENTENLHVGLSRNRGLEIATGEYVGFCDHDDYVAPHMYEDAYRTACETASDLVVCDVDFVDSEGGLSRSLKYPSGMSGEEFKRAVFPALLALYSKQDYSYGKTVWNMLFRRDFLEKNDLKFDDNRLVTAEDALLLSKAYFLTDRISHCESPQAVYYHVGHGSNTSNSYAWLNMDLAFNYVVNLNTFVGERVDTLQKERYSYDIAQGAVRLVYTGFLRELKTKGLRVALKKTSGIRRNKAMRETLKPLFSAGGRRYAFNNLPLTKLLFLIYLYL